MPIKSILHLIRWKNISIAVATLWITYFAINPDVVVCPIFSLGYFSLFSLVLVCVIAVGNIHNDICDVASDEINRPTNRVVDVFISPQYSWRYLIGFFILGCTSIIWLSYVFSKPTWLLFYLLFIGILFLYNRILKCTPIVGNIVIALLCACVVLIPLLLICREGTLNTEVNWGGLEYIPPFAMLAFVVNLIREIIKDLEDERGDRSMNCHTFVVVFGEEKTLTLIAFLTTSFLLGLLAYGTLFLRHISTSWLLVCLGLIAIPFLIFLRLIIQHKPFRAAQHALKWVLVAGLIVLLLLSNL